MVVDRPMPDIWPARLEQAAGCKTCIAVLLEQTIDNIDIIVIFMEFCSQIVTLVVTLH